MPEAPDLAPRPGVSTETPYGGASGGSRPEAPKPQERHSPLRLSGSFMPPDLETTRSLVRWGRRGLDNAGVQRIGGAATRRTVASQGKNATTSGAPMSFGCRFPWNRMKRRAQAT